VKQELINFTLLDKSCSKLDEKARRLFLYASIYQNPVLVEALEWIVGDESQPNPSIGDALLLLINWGLIAREEQGNETLFAMHTLVRDFAKQVSEKEGIERKKLLIRAAQHYENQVKITKNLWTHLEARDYYYQAEEWEKADDIVLDTYNYLVLWGHIELAINLLNKSIESTSGIREAAAMGNLAIILYNLGDWRTALKLHTEVKDIFEKEGSKTNVATALDRLGTIHKNQGNYGEAEKLYQQSMEISKDIGDKRGIAVTLHNLGTINYHRGNYDEAVKLYQQSLKIKEDLGDKNGKSKTLIGLGTINYEQGNYDEAVKLYQQGMEISKDIGDKSGIAIAQHNLANIHYKQGNYDEAVKLYQQSLKIQKGLGDKICIAQIFGQLGKINEKDKDFSAALAKYLIALFIFKDLKDYRCIKIAEKDIARLKEKMGEEAFNKAFDEIRRKHGT